MAAITLWHTTMSLDGFIAGPDDAMGWIFEYDFPRDLIDGVIGSTGAVLAGRRSHAVGEKDTGVEATKEPFGGAWKGPQFVLTHRPPAHDDRSDVTFLSDGVRNAVETARAAAGGGNVLILGADLARQVVAEGLMDEILVHLVPILLGDGVRLHTSVGTPPVRLEPVLSTFTGQVTNLRFRVLR